MLAGLGFVLVVFAYFRYPLDITIDPAMYLQAAELLLQGKKPYIDFIEINPPLIFYLNVPPVLLSQWTGISAVLTFKFCLLAYIGVMAICLLKVLSRHPLVSRGQAMAVMAIYFFLPAFCMYAKTGGQREHLFMTVFVPYFFLRTWNFTQRFPAGKLSIFLSICCAVMACLKPYFIFIVLVFELTLVCLRQSTKTLKQREIFAFVATCALYLVHFLFWPADMRAALFQDLLPEIAVHYGSYGRTLTELLQFRWYILLYGLLNVALLFWLGINRKVRPMSWTLAVFILSALGIYIAQGKGWYYQFIPLQYSIFLSVPWIYTSLKSRGPLLLRSFVALSLCFITYYTSIAGYRMAKGFWASPYMITFPDFGVSPVRAVIEKYSKSGDFVALMSASPIYSYPTFLRLNRYPATRYLFQFPMSFYNNPHETDESKPYIYKSFEQMSEGEAKYVQQTQSDIEKNKPPLIIFTNFKNEYDFLPNNFDTFRYFAESGLWSAMSSQYTQVVDTVEIKAFQRRESAL